MVRGRIRAHRRLAPPDARFLHRTVVDTVPVTMSNGRRVLLVHRRRDDLPRFLAAHAEQLKHRVPEELWTRLHERLVRRDWGNPATQLLRVATRDTAYAGDDERLSDHEGARLAHGDVSGRAPRGVPPLLTAAAPRQVAVASRDVDAFSDCYVLPHAWCFPTLAVARRQLIGDAQFMRDAAQLLGSDEVRHAREGAPRSSSPHTCASPPGR